MLLDPLGFPVAAPSPLPPAIGASRNLHLLWAARFKAWNDILAREGGYHEYGGPKYRIVWGWQRPEVYAVGGDQGIEFFRMERWQDVRLFYDEDEWYSEQRSLARLSSKYQIKPFPRHGEYVEIETCAFDKRDPDGILRPHFLEPRPSWIEWRLSRDFYRLARTKAQIRAEIAEDNALKTQATQRQNARMLEKAGVSEVAEDEVKLLHRNPTLRQDPDLMLSPAVKKKRTRHRIANTL